MVKIVTAPFFEPDWPAPANVKAISTLRSGGASEAPFHSLNLGLHVGDVAATVLANRQRLQALSAMPQSVAWLEQVHGNHVIELGARTHFHQPPTADASYTCTTGAVCIVMTADCLPLLLCDRQGTQVAAIHAGWRGLQAGIIEETVSRFQCPAKQLLVWLGPAISQAAFEVGSEVRAAFVAEQAAAEGAFIAAQQGKFFADIYQLARLRLQALGIEAIFGGDRCTYSEPAEFFSYRRDGQTGRQASAIWLQA